MNGIEILNKTVVTESPDWINMVIPCSLILSLLFFIILVNTDSQFMLILSGVLVAFIIIGDIILSFYEEPTDRCRYEVTLDKTVTIEELSENYNIVDQRGEIWILEDKEKKQ
jgi:ABC-type transport system involved in multi-copper enzyme maturation permease subunit